MITSGRLIAYAVDHASEIQLTEFNRLFGRPDLDDDEIQLLREILQDSRAVQAPVMSLDMIPGDNTYDDTTNTMTVAFNANTDFCLAAHNIGDGVGDCCRKLFAVVRLTGIPGGQESNERFRPR